MEKRNETTITRNGNRLTVSRLLNAERKIVWKVWTDPDHIKQWFGPDGFSITNESMDVKTGGSWVFTMHGFGQDFPNKILFTEVLELERMVYMHSGDGSIVPPFHVIVTLEARGQQTLITMDSVFVSVEALDKVNEEYNAIEGGRQNMNRLAEYVEQQAIISRD